MCAYIFASDYLLLQATSSVSINIARAYKRPCDDEKRYSYGIVSHSADYGPLIYIYIRMCTCIIIIEKKLRTYFLAVSIV